MSIYTLIRFRLIFKILFQHKHDVYLIQNVINKDKMLVPFLNHSGIQPRGPPCQQLLIFSLTLIATGDKKI